MVAELRDIKCSTWWKDLGKVCSLGPGGNWFECNNKWKVGDGKSVRFWEDKWLNDSLSLCKDKSVADVVSYEKRNGYENVQCNWNLLWRRQRFE